MPAGLGEEPWDRFVSGASSRAERRELTLGYCRGVLEALESRRTPRLAAILDELAKSTVLLERTPELRGGDAADPAGRWGGDRRAATASHRPAHAGVGRGSVMRG